MNDKSSDYVPTQIIAEFFRNEGFDGVVYKSVLSNGYNIALFDIDVANIVNCFLYEVEKVKFNFNQSAKPYFLRNEKNI